MAIRHTQVHRDTVYEAGYSTISPLSVIAGVLGAYGAFAIVAAIVGAVLSAADVNTDFQSNDWTGSGAVAALASAGVLLVAYLFGGYVAGRMARRAGMLHGVLVFLASLVLGAIVGGVVSAVGDSSDIERNLRSIGIPTSTDDFSDVAIVGVIVSLAAVLVGSLLGGMLGERWHTRLVRRAADPEIGTTADERERVANEEDERRERIARDDALAAHDRDIDLRDDEPRYTAAEWQAREDAVRR